MKKAQKTDLITLRISKLTRKAIKDSQRDYTLRDRTHYTFTEVSRYLLNAGLYSEGKLRDLPALDGRGARSRLSLQSELQSLHKTQLQVQRQLKQLDTRASALRKRVSNGGALS